MTAITTTTATPDTGLGAPQLPRVHRCGLR